MYFIGQDHITIILGDILEYTKKTKKGVALLFRGASGYGKTELAKLCCNYLVGRDYEMCLGKNPTFDPNKWVHFIDEVHNMETPEVLYPLIDEGKYVFVFATNFDSDIPEALRNRCKNYIFVDYSTNELIDIFKVHCNLPISNNVIKHIIEVSGRNPRVMVKTYIDNIIIHFLNKEDQLLNKTDEQLIEEIDKLHGIKDELDQVSIQYIKTLRMLGGRSSISLLAHAARIDVDTIKYTVEPNLIGKGLIRITSRGRELC